MNQNIPSFVWIIIFLFIYFRNVLADLTLFLWTVVIFARFSNARLVEWTKHSSKFESKRTSKISELSVIILVGISISWLAFYLYKILISLKILSCLTWQKVKLNLVLTFCFITRIIFNPIQNVFSPIQDGYVWGCSQIGGQKGHLPKICHTYSTMMKLSTVIPYWKKIQKVYKSRDIPLEFCWHQHF